MKNLRMANNQIHTRYINMLITGDCSDITLICEDKEGKKEHFYVHEFIIKSRTKLLSYCIKQNDTDYLSFVPSEIMKSLLWVLYSDAIDGPVLDHWRELCWLGHLFQARPLILLVNNYIQENVTSQEVITTLDSILEVRDQVYIGSPLPLVSDDLPESVIKLLSILRTSITAKTVNFDSLHLASDKLKQLIGPVL